LTSIVTEMEFKRTTSADAATAFITEAKAALEQAG